MVGLRRKVSQLNGRNSDLVHAILLRGESGSGKNHLSRVIAGHRRWLEIRESNQDPGLDAGIDAFTDRFGEIHLPALPENLIESELFGVRRGAFTGAREDRPGLLGGERARKEFKDILLDEVGDATPALQAKLLAVVEYRRFRPVGAQLDEEYSTSARLLMATNQDLEAMVRTGQFRRDLYWRIRLFVITIPPLREQPENIEPIAHEIERELKRNLPASLDSETGPELSEADLKWARQYDWPGNVRELRHAIAIWLLREGKLPLEQIVREMQTEDSNVTEKTDLDESIAALVRDRLTAASEGSGTAIGRLNDLVKEFEHRVKIEANRWYTAARPTDEQLQRIFPKHTSVASIRNKLSQWRKP